MNIKEMSFRQLIDNVAMSHLNKSLGKVSEAELLRRDSEKDARIKELLSGYDCKDCKFDGQQMIYPGNCTGCDLDEKYNFKLKS